MAQNETAPVGGKTNRCTSLPLICIEDSQIVIGYRCIQIQPPKPEMHRRSGLEFVQEVGRHDGNLSARRRGTFSIGVDTIIRLVSIPLNFLLESLRLEFFLTLACYHLNRGKGDDGPDHGPS